MSKTSETKRSARDHKAARRELADLAKWMEYKFGLGARPKVHAETEADRVYVELMRRIAEHGAKEQMIRDAFKMAPED
jgi:hypothetical protein